MTGGVVLRLDGSDMSALNGGSVTNGGSVSSWASSSSGLTALQGTGARQPVWNQTGSGLPMGVGSVSFDGSPTAGQGDRFSLSGLNLTTEMTAFVVAQFNPQGDNTGSCCRPFFSEDSSNFNAAGFGLGLLRPGNGSDLRFDRAGGTAPTSITSDIGAPDSQFHIFSVISDAANSETFDDGTSIGSAAIATTGTGTNYTIGGNVNNDARHYLGEIGEILIFDRALTPEEHALVGGFLEFKFGLDTAFPQFTPPQLTPEPTSILLLAAGLGGLFGMTWYRRRRQ